jgi:hypothetical protein
LLIEEFSGHFDWIGPPVAISNQEINNQQFHPDSQFLGHFGEGSPE